MARDGIAARCKRFESAEAGRRAMPGLPLLARLDGRAFHTFTRDLKRPYEPGMSAAMIETARYLVQESSALVGYTQSDEITLAWYVGSDGAYAFDGRFQKVASVLAGMASAKFCQLLAAHLPQKSAETPHFDCRVWQVPTLDDAAEVFVWREDDATKNSVTMAANAHYDERELSGKSTAAKHELLHAKGVNWNDYPSFFKRGTYLARRSIERELSDEELAAIPEIHRPASRRVIRAGVVELDLPPIRRIANRTAVLFEGVEPHA